MLRKAVGLTIGMLLLSGCASVKVQKIPDPSAYTYSGDGTCSEQGKSLSWNCRQTKADAIRGVRYYLPRPYVLVKKEFPVDGGTVLLSGTLDASRQLVLPEVPEKIAQLFGMSPEARTISLDGARLATPTAVTPGAETQSGSTDDAKPATEEKPELLLDSDDLLKDSAPGESQVSDPKATIRLTVKVSKDLEAKLELGDNETLATDKVYLVPLQNGKHVADKVVEATVYKSEGSTGKDRTLLAQIEGSKVPTFAALAVKVSFEKDGKKHSVLLHRKSYDLLNTFSSSGKGGDDSKKKDGEGDKDATKQEPKKVSGANITTSGDPTTDPLVYENDLYDILLLPDFSEQYAIQVRSGIFKAEADIALENGWMLEKLGTKVDNSTISEFIFDTAGKIVDLGLNDLFDVAANLTEAEGAEDAKEETESRAVGTPVTVRIDWIDYAVPGAYPIPKFREVSCPLGQGCEKEKLCLHKVKYETRRQLAITIVEFGEKAPGTVSPGAEETIRILNQDEVEAALKTIDDQGFLKIFDNGEPAVCGRLTLTEGADGNFRGDLTFPRGSVAPNYSSLLDVHRNAINAALKKAADIQADIFFSFKTCD